MTTIKFNNTNGQDIDNWNKAVKAFREWQGMGEVVFRKPTRTLAQNRLIHPFFKDLAMELAGLGFTINVRNFTMQFNEKNAKEFFIERWLDGKRTSKCNTKEITDGLQNCIRDVNILGGQLSISTKNFESLIKTYKK